MSVAAKEPASTPVIALYIVTDRAEIACRKIFGFGLREAPSWVAFIDSADGVENLPEEAPVLALWLRGESQVEAWWRLYRKPRRFDDDFAGHMQRISDWLSRRAAHEAALIAAYRAENGLTDVPAVQEPPAPEPVVETPHSYSPQPQLKTRWS